MSGPSKKEKKQENKNIDFSAGHGTQEVGEILVVSSVSSRNDKGPVCAFPFKLRF